MRRSAIKNLGIICAGVVWVASMIATASADEPSARISKSSLGSMGLAGMQSISDAAGHQVRGNRAILGSISAVGIPLDVVGGTRLVAILNWSYHPLFPDVPAIIWRHLRDTREQPELLPPAPREF